MQATRKIAYTRKRSQSRCIKVKVRLCPPLKEIAGDTVEALEPVAGGYKLL